MNLSEELMERECKPVVISGEKEEPSEEGFEVSHVELDLVRQGDCKKTLVM